VRFRAPIQTIYEELSNTENQERDYKEISETVTEEILDTLIVKSGRLELVGKTVWLIRFRKVCLEAVVTAMKHHLYTCKTMDEI
jgi:hypothetical protein